MPSAAPGDPTPSRHAPGTRFWAALGDVSRPRIDLATAVVVAHPDDETIGCGSLLSRLRDVTVIHVTDGAPRDPAYAREFGFSDPESLAAARRRELEDAMAIAGVGTDRLVAPRWSDQAASLDLAGIARSLATQLAGVEIVLTHSYEGGHPDHDATAFAVHAACGLLKGEGRPAPDIFEMPLYRGAGEGFVAQSFAPLPGAVELVLRLGEADLAKVRRMYSAHRSQQRILERFSPGAEFFRLAPRYGFSDPPNGGILDYETWKSGMTGARWLDLAAAALAELGLTGRI